MLFSTTSWLGVALLLFAAMVLIARPVRRHLRRKAREAARYRRCMCGYIVENLTSARCPECGRAVGFDKSFEELGVSEAELEEARRRKAERQRGAGPAT